MDKDCIRYTGRFDFSYPEGPAFAWSASSVSARFHGTEVSVELKSRGDNYFTVFIDGRIAINSLHAPENGIYRLAEGLEKTDHTVELVKRTEFYIGTAQFQRFIFGKGHILPLPPARQRRMEIIGDSITCGFGNEGPDQYAEYEHRYDNACLSYGFLAARRLDAEPMILGYSGYGIIRDYEGNEANTLPSKYSLITPEKPDEWDFSSWIPQVVVINLGTNDFSFGFIPDRRKFVRAYLDFIGRIHRGYPDAHVICSIGPLLDGEALAASREYVLEGVVNSLKREGNNRVSFLEYPHQAEEDGYGISWHPSIKTHEKMSVLLSETICGIMKWRQQPPRP